jgi:hypothetical protein
MSQTFSFFLFFFLKRGGRKISVMSVTDLSIQTFQNELPHSWLKKSSGQKRLNKEMSSSDTPSEASEYFGGEPGYLVDSL